MLALPYRILHNNYSDQILNSTNCIQSLVDKAISVNDYHRLARTKVAAVR